ncbi:MAG: hypothetical protein EOO75_11560 [Myxococcales bacterium]|nr:MAG: hypothetical protein EOO75_11560 [Myxococcales bacterium]
MSTPHGRAHASLASDGQRYVACWDTAGSPPTTPPGFRAVCVAVPVGGGAVTPLLSESGSGPTVAAGSQGMAVAYRPASGAIIVRYLDPDSGVAPRELPVTEPEMVFQDAPRALLAATAGGFAVVTPAASHFHRLDHGLEVIAGPVDLDPSIDFDWGGRPVIAALGDVVAVSVRLAYGNHLYVVDEHDQVKPTIRYSGGGKLGTDIALVAEATTFGAFWRRHLEGGASLLHESFEPAAPPVHTFEALDADPWSQGSSHPACALAVAALPGGASLVVHPTATGVAARRLE